MRTNAASCASLLLLLLSLVSGCATKALWQNGRLDACKEPADKSNLRLFEDKSQTNLLVVYDESSERNDSVRTRAYWLNENQGRMEQGLRPHFVPVVAQLNLPDVPVFYDPLFPRTKLPPELCAVVAPDRHSFTLFLANRPLGSHRLPVYNDGKGRVAKIALTPVAVTVDLTIIGTFIAYWYAWCNSGGAAPTFAGGGGPYQ